MPMRHHSPSPSLAARSPADLLEHAVFISDAAEVARLLPKVTDLEFTDRQGNTCAIRAAMNNAGVIFMALIKAKANPAAMNVHGNSAMHFFAHNRNTQMLQFLHGVCNTLHTQPNLEDATPLDWLSKLGKSDAREFLESLRMAPAPAVALT